MEPNTPVLKFIRKFFCIHFLVLPIWNLFREYFSVNQSIFVEVLAFIQNAIELLEVLYIV